MPCTDGGVPYHSDTDSGANREIESLKKRLDEVTQNLCWLCGHLESLSMMKNAPNSRLQKWWKEHQENDTRRVRKLMLKSMRADFNTQTGTWMADNFIKSAEKVHPVSVWHRKWFHTLAQEVENQVAREKKLDAKKKSKRQQALDKLTDEEKELLGID